MQRRAPYNFAGPRKTSRAFRSAVAAACLSGTLVCLSGCGSGVLGSAASQNTAVPVASAKGPQLGYVWMTSDRTLRPILGIAGASIVGQSVVPAGLYTNATSSSPAGIALLQAADASFDLMRLPNGTPVTLKLMGATGAVLRLSPSAASALVFSPGAISASLVTGLKSTPVVQSVAAPGPVSDAAVSDSGTVAIEYTQGSRTGIAVLVAGGHAVPLTTIGSGGGIALLPGSAAGTDDLLFADAATNVLTLVRSASSTPSMQVIPTGSLLNRPVAVGISNSGRWALVANSSTKTLVRIDLRTLAAVSVACACQPTISEPLADDGAFRVTGLASGTNWIVDAAAATPRTLFLPPLPNSTATANVATAVQP